MKQLIGYSIIAFSLTACVEITVKTPGSDTTTANPNNIGDESSYEINHTVSPPVNMANETSFYSENLDKADDYSFNKNDERTALIYYRKSAEEGNPIGMASLAPFYKNGGGGLTKDESQANYWGERHFYQ